MLTTSDTSEFDPASFDFRERCTKGYRNTSLLCSGCANGYSLADLGGECKECPTEEQNVGITAGGGLAGIIFMVIIVRLTLSDAGSVDAADGIKLILMSYLQMATLLVGFPILWPKVFVDLFQIGGAVTALGQHLVNLKCLARDQTEADVFFNLKIVWALMPFVLVFMCVSTWWAVKLVMRKIDMYYPKVYTSCVALVYLVYILIYAQRKRLQKIWTKRSPFRMRKKVKRERKIFAFKHLIVCSEKVQHIPLSW